MSIGLWFFIIFLFLPFIVFVWAVLPEILYDLLGHYKKEKDSRFDRDVIRTSHDYCYGGLNFRRVVVSTIGTVLSVGTILNATLGALFTGGSLPFFSWLIGAVFVYPAVLYVLLNSQSVRTFYSQDTLIDLQTRKPDFRSQLSFISADYGNWGRRYFFYVIMIIFSCLLILEISFMSIWVTFLMEERFSYPVLFPIFFVSLCFIYVYVGGYPAVLRTDSLQFLLIFLIFGSIVVALLLSRGLSTEFWSGILRETLAAPTKEELATAIGDQRVATGNILELGANYFFLAFSAFSLMGIWFLSAPDLWNRLTQSMYVKNDFGNNPNAQRKKFILFLILVATFIGLADIPMGYLGSYGFVHKTELGLPPTDVIRSTTVVVNHFVLGEGFGASNTSPPPGFSTLGDFFLIAILCSIILFSMTTIDTALVGVAQTWCDNETHACRKGRLDNFEPSIFEVRSIVFAVFCLSVGLSVSAYFVGGQIGVYHFTLYVAVLASTLGGANLFMIIVRVCDRTWLSGNGGIVCLLHMSGIVATFAISLILFISRVPLPILGFGDRAVVNLGRIFFIEGLVFLGVFFIGRVLSKNSSQRRGNGRTQ